MAAIQAARSLWGENSSSQPKGVRSDLNALSLLLDQNPGAV